MKWRTVLLLFVLPSMGGAIGVRTLSDGSSAIPIGDHAVGSPGVQIIYYSQTWDGDSHSRPACEGDSSCVWQVRVSSGGAVSAVDDAGASVGVTEGTGLASAATPWDTFAALDVDVAEAPRLTSPGSYSFALTGAHTLVFEGYSTEQTNATFQYLFEQVNGTTGFYARQEGSAFKCVWQNSGATPTTVTRTASGSTLEEGYIVAACRKTGTGAGSTYSVHSNLNHLAEGAWAFDPADPTTGAAWFGRRNNSGSEFPLRGVMGSVTLYSEAKTDAELEAIVKGVFGVSGLETSGTWHATQNWIVDSAGYYVPIRATSVVDDEGLYVQRSDGNDWAADATDASSWTNVGAPTVVSAVAAGPFTRWQQVNSADSIEDNDGAAFEGKQSTGSAGSSAGEYTASCILAPGTTDLARLVVDTDGTGTTSCDVDIDADCTAQPLAGYYRCTCSASVTGSPTYVRGQILVGNVVSDTGAINVDHCQIEPYGWASSPKPDNVNHGGGDPYVGATEVGTWFGGDVTTGGEVEAVFKLDKASTEVQANDDTPYFFDISDGSGHAALLYWLHTGAGACTANHLCFQHYNSGCAAADYTTLSTSTVAFEAGQWYAARVTWDDSGNTAIYFNTCADPASCSATVEVGSGAGKCVTNVTPDRAHLGQRYSNTFPLDGHLRRFTVGGL